MNKNPLKWTQTSRYQGETQNEQEWTEMNKNEQIWLDPHLDLAKSKINPHPAERLWMDRSRSLQDNETPKNEEI